MEADYKPARHEENSPCSALEADDLNADLWKRFGGKTRHESTGIAMTGKLWSELLCSRVLVEVV